jgi:hypothetical protein
MRPTQEEQRRQGRKKRRPFGFCFSVVVSLVLLLVCLKVVDASKKQGMTAYIAAASSALV